MGFDLKGTPEVMRRFTKTADLVQIGISREAMMNGMKSANNS